MINYDSRIIREWTVLIGTTKVINEKVLVWAKGMEVQQSHKCKLESLSNTKEFSMIRKKIQIHSKYNISELQKASGLVL